MKSILHYALILISLLSFNGVQSQVLVSTTDLGFFSKNSIIFLGITSAEYDMQLYKVNYNTTDNDGNNVVASGMIAVPLNVTCDSVPIALYAHGVVSLRDDVPSRDNSESILGKSIASRGFITAMPDYLGLGDLPGLHPFQHAASEARVSLDIMRATMEFIEDSLTYHYNNQVYITGYSQGGHTAMATHKYIQDNNLESEFNIVASAPLSGAYSSSKTQANILLDDIPFGSAGFAPYMIMAYEETYGGIYSTPSDFLQSPYDVTIPPLFDGNHDLSEISDSLPNKASEYLTAAFLASFIADTLTKTGPMWQALLDNDNYDWTPEAPMKLMYCGGDQTVFPENSINAFNAMTANGATDVTSQDLGNASHTGCVVGAIGGAINFFLDNKPGCTPPLSTASISVNTDIQFYPNPSADWIEFTNPSPLPIEIRTYSITGVLMQSINVTDQVKVDVSSWKEGIYLIQYFNGQRQITKKLIVKH